MKDTKYNIHATNINGLGAINVANEILNSLMPLNNIQKIYYSNGIKSAENNNNYFLYKRIFPNPISEGETLNLRDLPDGKKQISVFNNLGQLIFFEKTHSEECSIQRKNWKGGVYFVLIENKNERQAVK